MSTNGSDKAASDQSRQFFRHILATIAYRGGKTLRGAPESFAAFRIAETSRTPAQILAHIADLVEWTFRQVRGEQWLVAWHPAGPSTWDNDVVRFFNALEQLDNAFATEQPSATTLEVWPRDQSPMYSPISVNWECCAGLPGRRSKAR